MPPPPPTPIPHFTEPTTSYWQSFLTASEVHPKKDPPFRYCLPVHLPNSTYLLLPIRQLPTDPTHAVASLLVNAASLHVVDALAGLLADQLRPYEPDVVVGLPTLGHALCPGVARGLGHVRYVPLGYSRKFWYDPALSTPALSSITSPEHLGQKKRLWLDPHQLPLLLAHKGDPDLPSLLNSDRPDPNPTPDVRRPRVALIDDAVSTGTTLLAAWNLLESLGVDVVVCGVAMLQGGKWRGVLGAERSAKVVGVFESPLLERVEGGWTYRT